MPTPCGLGLKFTVGTAVSVPPLGQEVKRQRRSDGPGTAKERGGGGGGRGDAGEHLVCFISGIFIK